MGPGVKKVGNPCSGVSTMVSDTGLFIEKISYMMKQYFRKTVQIKMIFEKNIFIFISVYPKSYFSLYVCV